MKWLKGADVADDIEIHFDPGRGELSLSCGAEAFARIRDAVVVAAELAEVGINGVPAGIQTIVVDRVPQSRSTGRLGCWLAGIGCVVVGTAVVFVLAVGVRTITGWVR